MWRIDQRPVLGVSRTVLADQPPTDAVEVQISQSELDRQLRRLQVLAAIVVTRLAATRADGRVKRQGDRVGHVVTIVGAVNDRTSTTTRSPSPTSGFV